MGKLNCGMALAIDKENYFLHKVHSLTGVVPVGYYMVQHLVLNSFTIAGPDKFNAVIGFFESMPKHFLLTLEICMIWIPLLFHAVYGMFIVYRAKPNYFGSVYGWSRNLMYTLQRWTGVFLFFFLIIHVASTTGMKYLHNDAKLVEFDAWYTKLSSPPYLWIILYVLGVAAASFHLGSGIWNFCVRWGITVSDKAQNAVQKFSIAFFVVVTLIGWAALGGFLIHGNRNAPADTGTAQVMRQTHTVVASR